MNANTYKEHTKRKKPKSLIGFRSTKMKISLGLVLVFLSLFLFVAIISYLFHAKADQSIVTAWWTDNLKETGKEVRNWLGIVGAFSAHYVVYKWLGIGAILLVPVLFAQGYYFLTGKRLLSGRYLVLTYFSVVWLGLLLGYFTIHAQENSVWGYIAGGVGYEIASLLFSLMGWATLPLIFLVLLVFIVLYFNVTRMPKIGMPFRKLSASTNDKSIREDQKIQDQETENDENDDDLDANEEIQLETIDHHIKLEKNHNKEEFSHSILFDKNEKENEIEDQESKVDTEHSEVELQIEEKTDQESEITDEENDWDDYDPTLDLSQYQYPPLSILDEVSENKIQVTKSELEANKNKIVETLSHYQISISTIKATIGPTVTLYEIVPEKGIRISKIKNLEDDIALSLAALGIRIIAPIPGKGTIGIEVPNKTRELVSIKSIFSSDKFKNTKSDLPIIFGRTVTNELFMIDLAKMPHLLIAGATGQGKSVGLNVLLASLLYKKHPSQLKFVLVDPKKVELSLFNKIEKHFLAKLPNEDDAIITDTSKVIHTLNSLCVEMDSRYNLLKEASCRNLKEYNQKFVSRKLNPNKGHRFMPYIVLVIDELADLMMTAGKEVEQPIARIAQLARAIGIHLVVATQRPSVNVITGIIKANFPARISFKVTSKIDSRTILDAGGAEQLIGMGDMLFSHGSDITRVQCAFVDTPEVEDLCDFIADQQGYPEAYLLPEVEEEIKSDADEVDLNERDQLFEEAARVIVMHQQGSTSLLQRRLKLGYNRAGRLIDQLEKAGIVGPFSGSKAREVLIRDEYALEQLLKDLNQN